MWRLPYKNPEIILTNFDDYTILDASRWATVESTVKIVKATLPVVTTNPTVLRVCDGHAYITVQKYSDDDGLVETIYTRAALILPDENIFIVTPKFVIVQFLDPESFLSYKFTDMSMSGYNA